MMIGRGIPISHNNSPRIGLLLRLARTIQRQNGSAEGVAFTLADVVQWRLTALFIVPAMIVQGAPVHLIQQANHAL
jgi:hypothetical protein